MKQLKISRLLTDSEKTETLNRYLKDVKELSFALTAEEEASLARRIRAGDRAALNELVNSNLRFVISVANQYSAYASLEDLINEGNLGLIKAAQKFDETKGAKFISYAVWWVRDSIVRYVAQVHPIVKIPFAKSNDAFKYRTAERLLEQAFERKPTVSEIAESLNSVSGKNYSDSYVEVLAEAANQTRVSINEAFDFDLDLDTDGEGPVGIPEPADELNPQVTVRRELVNSLKKLDDRERYIVTEFFGLAGEAKTLEQIGQRLGISRERVRQLRNETLLKLRETVSEEFRFFES